MSAEISATLAEEAIYYLDAPVVRINTKEVPIPYPEHLEQASIPQVTDIVQSALSMLNKG
jgi:pyruvate/2-oxoglutarate/acetoin dehydrogenase E1 component